MTVRSTDRLVIALAVVVAILAVGLTGIAPAASADTPVDSAPIHPQLHDADGPTEVVVVFDSPPATEIAAADDSIGFLQDSADEHFAPLRALAAVDDAITVESTDWLSHSATVTIDTEVRSVAALGVLPGAVAVEPPATFALEPTVANASAAINATAVGDTTYGLDLIDAPAAWDAYDTRGAGVTVAVLDTGVDADHPDIDVHGWEDFATSDPASMPKDYGTHGTHVAGTVIGGNASGTAIGVAPEAELLAGAVLTEPDGTGSLSQVLDGMAWAVEEEADIISLSLGSEDFVASYIQAVHNAHAIGTTVVAATGNDGLHTASTPGNIYDLISVGAVNQDRDVWFHSGGMLIDTVEEWGFAAPDDWPETYRVPDVTAPGVDVYSALPGGEYGSMTGTSMATPHVSGVVALVQSATPNQLGPETMLTQLTESADHPLNGDQDIDWGHGIVDAPAAIEAAMGAEADGTVTDAVTGAPIDEVEVTVTGSDGTVVATAVTDGEGQYAVDGLVAGETYTFSFEHASFEAETVDGVVPDASQLHTVDVSLEGAAALEVTIDDASSNQPITDAAITVAGPLGTYPVSDASHGTYLVASLPSNGDYEVTVEATGYEPADQVVSITTPGHIEADPMALTGDASLELAVDDATFDRPITNATITAEGTFGTYPVIGDGNGTYASVSLPSNGDYEVTVDASGYEATEVSTSVTSAGPSDMGLVELTGDATLAIEVTDSDGDGIGEANLTIATADGLELDRPLATDDDGRFDQPVAGLGSAYTVEVSADGYESASVETGPIDPGDHEDVSVELTSADGIPGFGMTVAALAAAMLAVYALIRRK